MSQPLSWLLLILTLPTDAAALRMRLWRSLKAAGAAVLRDGVYLLPAHENCRQTFLALGAEVNASSGTAYQVDVLSGDDERWLPLFDRTENYRGLLNDIEKARQLLQADTAQDAEKQAKKQRKVFHAAQVIDYFPQTGLSQQVETALCDWERDIRQWISPDEPTAIQGELSPLSSALFQGRCWATRRRPWVDRLASAWLIQRFIDSSARILWLETPEQCPADAVGFDFNGATFSHVGNKVTFETLISRFQLDSAAIRRLASIVHFLDVGGIEPAEAAGVERVLAGLRETLHDDDQLLAAAGSIFDGLLRVFQKDKES